MMNNMVQERTGFTTKQPFSIRCSYDHLHSMRAVASALTIESKETPMRSRLGGICEKDVHGIPASRRF